MNLSSLVSSYLNSPRLKARLVKSIRYNQDGAKHIMRKGTISDLLIARGDNQYHFEAKNTAITVTQDEIEFIKN